MDIKILDYFLAFTEEENISRTAQKLHISQPSLSRYLMQLEDYFDTELFIRENRNIKLTKEGMIVRDNVREILDIIEKTHDEIKKSKKDFCGDIYIGC